MPTAAKTARPSARRAAAAPAKSAAPAAAARKPRPAAKAPEAPKARKLAQRTQASLTLSSRNYSSWSLRGWLLCRFAGLDVEEVTVSPDDAAMRKELLLLAPSILVPCLTHDGAKVWNTMAIATYLHEQFPKAGLLPTERKAAAHCLSVCGEMNAGFANLRSALPMNLKARHPGFKIWAGAQPDIERITEIWRECLALYGGPYLFGARRTMADAMFAPVATRFITYDVTLDKTSAAYRDTLMGLPEMKAWQAAALAEPSEIEELDMEF